MVKYEVNLKFKENGKSLNEIITNALKIELEKQYMTCNILNKKVPLEVNYYSQGEGSMD